MHPHASVEPVDCFVLRRSLAHSLAHCIAQLDSSYGNPGRAQYPTGANTAGMKRLLPCREERIV